MQRGLYDLPSFTHLQAAASPDMSAEGADGSPGSLGSLGEEGAGSITDMDFGFRTDAGFAEVTMELAAAIESSISGVLDHSQLELEMDLQLDPAGEAMLRMTGVPVSCAPVVVVPGVGVGMGGGGGGGGGVIRGGGGDSYLGTPDACVPMEVQDSCRTAVYEPSESGSSSPEVKYSDTLLEMGISPGAEGQALERFDPTRIIKPDSTEEERGDDCGSGEECERAGRRRSDEEAVSERRPHLLPPCKVCGTQATGFHYGVNTCEACKGFFRRCLLRKKDTMRCMKGAKCAIVPGKRNMCVLCRYNKCLQAGMSVEGIKTGRYTYQKRTQDIIELQRLRREECALVHQTNMQVRNSLAMETVMTVIRSQEKNLKESLQSMQLLYNAANTSEMLPSPQPGASHNELALIDTKKQRLAGLYKSMEKGLISVVRFAKDLPAFKLLPLSDQLKIFKSSTFEVWLIARHRAFDSESGLYSTINGYTIMLRDLLEPEFYDSIIRTVDCLKRLDLTIDETVVLKALAYFFTDRCELSRPDLVEEGQAKIIDALSLLLAKNHPTDRFILPKVISALAMVREPSEIFYGKTSILLQFLDSDSVPLMHEVLNTPP